MEKLKELIEQRKQLYPDLLQHPNFNKVLRWELIEIELQETEEYFIDLFENNKKYDVNENNLLVCKLLGICDSVDLNIEPKTKTGEQPDVDVDYLPIVRDYLKNVWAPKTFGASRVCNIGNYGTFGLKSTLLDMARVHGLERQEILNITTELKLKDDEGQSLTYDKALEIYPKLKAYCEAHPEVAKATQKLLHRNRSMGKHAGGLILCNQDIDKFVPLVRGTDGEAVSAWVEGLHGQDLGPVGLIKFDLLVVNSLWQIALTVRFVKERHNLKNISACDGGWDWSDLSYLNDPLSISTANAGDLKCIFQYDSDGIRKLVSKGGVDSFDDLVAYVSIYRPSALDIGADVEYVERKKGIKSYEIPEPLREALGSTYGLFIYQEQVMQVLHIVGKIPLRDCYQVIKAISKKKLAAFQKYKDKFIQNGQLVLGQTKEELEQYWSTIEAWAGYGFNRSLTEDTIIPCVDGAKQIKDICVGDKVFSVNEQGEQVQTDVVGVHDHGILDVVEVTFDDGYKIKCTLDHKFLTKYGQIPLWKIIQDNLDVLCSPLGDQNDKADKVGDILWTQPREQKGILQSCEEMRNLSKKTQGKEVVEKFSMWNSFFDKKTTAGAFEGLPNLFEKQMEIHGKKTHIKMWERIVERMAACGTSSCMFGVHGNKEGKYKNKDGKTKQTQLFSQDKGDIFYDCKKDFCKKRCAGGKSNCIEKMEREQSGKVCQVNRKSSNCFKEIQNGNMVEEFSRLENSKNTLRKSKEICGFSKENYLDRSGRSISFLANWIKKQQEGSRFRLHSKQRSNAKRRMLEQGEYNFNKTEHEMFCAENWRNETELAGTTPEYAEITNTGNLVSRRILRIVPMGKQQCYDIEVSINTHNFILPNGIATSNSHATCYSYISARQLYLKVYYPIEFFTATLMCESNDETLREYITEAENHGVTVCGLDINKSKETFSIVDGKIFIGFSNIKGIGEEKAKRIVEMQPYSGFEDFLNRFGTEASVLKALIPLRVFDEAEPEILYRFWIKYSEFQKKINDKKKRYAVSMDKLLEDFKAALPENFSVINSLSEKVFSFLKEYVSNKDVADKIKILDIINKFENKYKNKVSNMEEKVSDHPVLSSFDPNSVEIEDTKVLPLLKKKRLAQEAFYGYVWDNRIKQIKDYIPNKNFVNLRKASDVVGAWTVLLCEVLEVNKRTFKNGKGQFASILVMDDNFETGRITVWEEDYDRFKAELKKGNLVSMHVCPPSNGFPSYTFKSPPKHKRYELPKDKKNDYRVVLYETGDENV